MLHIIRGFIVALLLCGPGLGHANSALSEAMGAIRAQNWTEATRAVRRAGAVERDIVAWHRLRAGQGNVAEALDFLGRRADWPGLGLLRKRTEKRLEGASRRQVLALFDGHEPQTSGGALAYASALRSAGRKDAAEDVIKAAWMRLSVGSSDHAQFSTRYGDLLKGQHVARMDVMLWRGWDENATRMLPLMPDGWRALARARMGLRQNAKGVDTLIEAVPAGLQNDPGLAYERFLWRARKGRDEAAIELLLARTRTKTLGQPEQWAGRRRALARSSMRAGQYKTAYVVAADHGLSAGSAYADLEWLSGYVALRFLNKPKRALTHFQRFDAAVQSPISRGRAGYWLGRTHEALGNGAAAKQAYAAGGAHQTSFYGLLAAEKAGMAVDPALRGKERFADWKRADYTKSSVHKAALILLKSGELSLAERFWVHLAETQTRDGLGQMGQMAVDLKEPHIAVMLGKQMVKRGITLPGPYYALHPLAKRRLPVPAEMALAIARRESEFDPSVISHAGARGLMQLMPGTAKQVSAELGVGYSKSGLISDPNYNTTLGSAYLAGLVDQFDGNVILVAAGYNAGPHRSVRWMKERGDPRLRSIDMIDWIEHIPFNETRNYVMRVAESLPVYRARLGQVALPVPFSQEVGGGTLKRSR